MSFRLLRGFNSRHVAPLCAASGVAFAATHRRNQVCRLDASGSSKWPETESLAAERKADEATKVSASGQALPTGSSEAEGKAWFEHDDDAAWQSFSARIADIGSGIAGIRWSSVGDKVTDFIVPTWAQALPGYVRKLQGELEMAPGSLASEIMTDSEDPFIHPEIDITASVLVGNDLCEEELAFQQARRLQTSKALARYLEIPESEIDPRDVPTIAMCGSGGGLRALVAGTSSYMCTQQANLFDCVTYTAGVSGSCWLQTLYYSSLGRQSHQRIIDHLKKRINVHIAFPTAALRLLTSAPTSKFLLSGLLEKSKGDPDADFGLVDIYGLLLAARLLVPRGELEVDQMDLKLSNQRRFIRNGSHPLPLYTMVRHEIPAEDETSSKDKNKDSWFSWWEMSPYYVWCEELGAGIPTWSLGRIFKDGTSIRRESGWNLPEMRVPQLLGIWGSAFCATLSHYYNEVRPVLQGVAGFGGIDSLLREHDDDLVKLHPIDPASIPNFALGLEGQLPSNCPKSIFKSSHLRLMDAGMSNNLPIYPLLRPGRNVDIIIAFDASADIKKENWLHVADNYAKQRGIRGWPSGLGWPQAPHLRQQLEKDIDATQEAVEASNGETTPPSSDDDLGPCTIWLGSNTAQRSAPSSSSNLAGKRVDPTSDWATIAGPDSGLAVIYFPLLPNPKVPGVDPDKSDFMSTWNFIYTPEEIDKVAALARANFEEGEEQTKQCVRAIYERKKRARLVREEEENRERWRRRWKGGGDLFR
ncbi:hypothetical protein MMC10_005060 [Thelotrema lepadinum]|nr:hypothetical protein [Thelotrema lepadinum]